MHIFTFRKIEIPKLYSKTMKFHSPAQEKALARALQKKYKAVAFDIDGTLTHFGRWVIPSSLRETLLSLPKTIPLAFCTGRSYDHIVKKLNHICETAADPIAEHKRWYVLAENGGACYEYKSKKKSHELFHEVHWPTQLISQEALAAQIKNKYGWHVQVVIRDHSLVVRYPDWLYLFPRSTRIISRHTASSFRRFFEKIGLDGHFQIQDSGIGLLVIPEKSGKGKAVRAWSRHLKIPLSQILVIGDQPLKGENDEEFLSGRFGTPFTVGHQGHNNFPLPVLDGNGRKLKGPAGTEFLLKRLF